MKRHGTHACWPFAVLAASWTWAVAAEKQISPIQLRDVTAQTGITFVHNDGSSGRRYIVETVSAGLALFDYDNDGDEDIYFLNGAALPGTKFAAAPRDALYRNDGNWKFTDVTQQAGVGDTGHGLGVTVGDYDADGNLDLYLNNFGPNVLYRNNGDGTFSDVTKAAGVGNGSQVGAGTCFLDMDADGDLDLYVANYVDFNYANHRTSRIRGRMAYAGPKDFPPTADTLYRNNGDGTFSDVSAESGVAGHKGTGMGMVCFDLDQDGDTDVVVGNDVGANFVFRNDGTGRFEEVGLLSGLAYDLVGTAQGTMGVECGDFNNDGLLDCYMTSYQHELATLYMNLGDGLFEDVTRATGAGDGTLAHVTWGCGLVDFDNDGWRDIFVACGHLQDMADLLGSGTSYHARNILLRNAGNGRFVNVSDQCGDGLRVNLTSRGAVFDDLDNDGDVDAVILNSRREPTLLRNDSPPGNHWIQIHLRGTRGNRFGVGSQVIVQAGDLSLVDEVHSGRGYQGHYGLRLHFGLGKHDRIDRIRVKWLGGGVQTIADIAADRVLTITESTAAKSSQVSDQPQGLPVHAGSGDGLPQH